MSHRESDQSDKPSSASDRKRVLGLSVLFGMLYFSQGIGEPTEGLIAQPTRSLLRNWGYSADTVAAYLALLALPWAIKPIYGLLTDFVPIGGTRRRAWLLLTTLVTSAALIALYFYTPPAGMAPLLVAWLLLATMGVAFSDVVVDALMVEEGKPRGLTGQLQSVQWASMWTATILTGFLGGLLSQRGQQEVGFLIAGLAMAGSFLLALFVVREPKQLSTHSGNDASQPVSSVAAAAGALGKTLRHPAILAIGAFLFLWNFNPFSTAVLYMHMVEHMGFSEQFYGNTVTVQAVGSLLASLSYATYCRRLSVLRLVHLSIAAGVLATIAYWGLVGTKSALVISFVVGFVYMTATMIQLDLAARVCDLLTAGTTFALLMSLTNLAVSLSMGLGGTIYVRLAERHEHTFAFHVLVGIGALFTGCCWLLVPVIRRYCERGESEAR
jgi:Na+/melibiose symporter-like transporter